ncbi:hypothetical protein [Borreliella burgdorferi]|nr:hypothetical protein [Borreliella burgdorferi]
MVKAATAAAGAANGGTGDKIGKVVKAMVVLQQQKVVKRRVLMGLLVG